MPLRKFWPAEDYHQDYFEKHPDQGYCAVVIRPKVDKLKHLLESRQVGARPNPDGGRVRAGAPGGWFWFAPRPAFWIMSCEHGPCQTAPANAFGWPLAAGWPGRAKEAP